MRGRLFLVALALTSLGARTAAAQGTPVGLGGAVVAFAGFGGDGFAPAPSTTQLDSDVWMPWGIDGVPSFGGTCVRPTGAACARGVFGGVLTGLAPGVYAVPSIPGFVPSPGVGLQSGLLAGSTLRPGGLRFRFHNIEAVPLRAAVVTVHWASNAGTLLRNDLVVLFDAGCDHVGAVPLMRSPTAGVRIGPWDAIVDTFEPFDVNVPSMAEGCLELNVGSTSSLATLGLTAVFEVAIEFPPPVCHDDIIETGEECEIPAGTTPPPCGCDDACLFPRGTPCDLGAGPCVGACAGGHCTSALRTDTFPVEGCDDGLFCDGLERCVEGACTLLADSLCPADDVCAACEEDLDLCSVPIPGCCASGDACTGPCDTGLCIANVCEVDPACFAEDASVVPDGSMVGGDASVPPPDAMGPDGSNIGVDGGDADGDGGSSAFDGGNDDGVAHAFGGGGGCRCAAAGRGASGGPALGLGLLLVLARQARRRRRTRETPQASA